MDVNYIITHELQVNMYLISQSTMNNVYNIIYTIHVEYDIDIS